MRRWEDENVPSPDIDQAMDLLIEEVIRAIDGRASGDPTLSSYAGKIVPGGQKSIVDRVKDITSMDGVSDPSFRPDSNYRSDDPEDYVWESAKSAAAAPSTMVGGESRREDEETSDGNDSGLLSPGTKVVNRLTRKEGEIVEYNEPTGYYIVRYRDNDRPVLEDPEALVPYEEFYKPVTPKKEPKAIRLTSPKEEGNEGDTEEDLLKEMLTDPSTAPAVIKFLLERGKINREQALSLLAKIGAIPDRSTRRKNQ